MPCHALSLSSWKDGCPACPWFDRLTTNGFDRLTTNGFDGLTTKGFEGLTMNGFGLFATSGMA